MDKEIVAVRGLVQSVAVGAGGDLGDDLGSWPVRIEDEKGSDCETEKQKCCDKTGSGGLLASDYGWKFFVWLTHGTLGNN